MDFRCLCKPNFRNNFDWCSGIGYIGDLGSNCYKLTIRGDCKFSKFIGLYNDV